MKKIKIKASTDYDILLGYDLLKDLHHHIKGVLEGEKIAIITCTNVDLLYGKEIEYSLNSKGLKTYKYVFKSGEESKNIHTYFDILRFLAKNNFSRNDTILALGGGVVGDISGFVAATYMRGIKYIGVPTTLLAIVDSSVGGKTAIDLPEGKNLAGAFHPPALVIADLNTLKTLPPAEVQNGMGEVVKYGILMGKKLFDIIPHYDSKMDEIIELCILYKKQIVEEDEKEGGIRRLLNLGHTLGHSIEKLSGYSIPHGVAVGMGIFQIAKLSHKHYGLAPQNLKKILSLLSEKGLNAPHSYSVNELIEVALSDKKVDGKGMINFVVIKDIGDCRVEKVTFERFKEYLQ